MKKQTNPCKALPVGQAVAFRRKTGEDMTGRILSAPIPHLMAFGEFYLVGRIPDGPEPFYRGSGRKSKERLRWEAERSELGMYERSQLTVVA